MTCKSQQALNAMLQRLRAVAAQLLPGVAITVSGGWNKTVTINKQDIRLCVCDEQGNVHDENTLTWVLIHELAHVQCKSIGHTAEWNAIHERLIEQAVRLGLYNPKKALTPWYCGVRHH